MKKEKTETIHIRIDKKFKQQLMKKAKDEHRTITAVIMMMLEEYMK